MTGTALVSALIIGLAVGLAGRLVVPGRTAAPVWLTLALGVAAAQLGSITLRLAGADLTEEVVPRLIVQVGFAGVAVVLAALAAGRQGVGERTTPSPVPPPDRRLPAMPSTSSAEREERS